jgi:hypothetical protein
MLLSLGLDYFRWTQLTPMILTWGFALLLLAMLIFVNFQQQVVNVLEYFVEWLMKLPLVGPYVTEFLAEQDQTVKLGTEDLKTFALRSWFVISLLFMLTSMLLSRWLGPFRTRSLKRKILYAAIASLALLAGMLLNYFVDPGNFNGGLAGWLFNFSLIALIVFLVSAYSLTIAHVLGKLSSALMEEAGGVTS